MMVTLSSSLALRSFLRCAAPQLLALKQPWPALAGATLLKAEACGWGKVY
jgi:hypothetical protein